MLKCLREAAVENKQDIVAREQIYARLEEFQTAIEKMYWRFCELAHIGLLEKDAVEKFVMGRWDWQCDSETRAVATSRAEKHYREQREALRTFLGKRME